eukprot:GHVU01065244.1.p1 GENE.GHVU01065244.1~~GHVU01065244.1.p1  ORF type:complete len:138 (+),score=22.65 GHVU01065244.1:55-468(+)
MSEGKAAAKASRRVVSREELARHNKAGDAWMAIHGVVYDVSKFDEHPGGKEVLDSVAGKDGTQSFEDTGHSNSARHMAEKFEVGVLEGMEGAATGAVVSEDQAAVTPSNRTSVLYPLLAVGMMLAAAYYHFYYGGSH